jgi:hypothetical protein
MFIEQQKRAAIQRSRKEWRNNVSIVEGNSLGFHDFDPRILPYMREITDFLNVHEDDETVFAYSSRIDNPDCCVFVKVDGEIKRIECLATAGFIDGSWLSLNMQGERKSFSADQIV